jgi:hypothetical protein
VGHEASMGGMRSAYKIFVGKPEMKIPLLGPRYRWVDTSRMDLREGRKVWTGFIDSGQGPLDVFCILGNEFTISLKIFEFIDYLTDYRVFKKDYSPWIYTLRKNKHQNIYERSVYYLTILTICYAE